MAQRILVVDDRKFARDLVASELEEAGFAVMVAGDGEQGWRSFQAQGFDLVVTDLRMPSIDGMALLRRIRSSASRDSQVPVVLLSAYGTLSIAAEAGKAGATDFYPFSEIGVDQLVVRVREILNRERPEIPEALAGSSAAVVEARNRVLALTGLDAPVLLRGESGSGRNTVAEFIHRSSPRAPNPFLILNCESRPPLGDPVGGTLYLDRVDRLSRDDQRFWRKTLGRMEAECDDVRVLASSSDDLRILAEEGSFDEELSKWLSRFTVLLPPLRNRPEDISSVACALAERFAVRVGRSVPDLSEAAIVRLSAHPWHGNLAELERVIETLVAYDSDGCIDDERVEAVLAESGSPLSKIAEQRMRDERKLLLSLYRKHGTYTGVARELGITRNAAKYRFARHDLVPARPPTRRGPPTVD